MKIVTFFTGFKSRVKFYNVKDPMRISDYISEIVDAGFMGPLFRVKAFHNVFISFCYA